MSRSTIILAIVAILILGAAAYLLFGRSDIDPAVSGTSSEVTDAEMTFVSLIARIEPISFDASIVDDPRFSILRDIRTAIVDEASGRTDPFAPLGR